MKGVVSLYINQISGLLIICIALELGRFHKIFMIVLSDVLSGYLDRYVVLYFDSQF